MAGEVRGAALGEVRAVGGWAEGELRGLRAHFWAVARGNRRAAAALRAWRALAVRAALAGELGQRSRGAGAGPGGAVQDSGLSVRGSPSAGSAPSSPARAEGAWRVAPNGAAASPNYPPLWGAGGSRCASSPVVVREMPYGSFLEALTAAGLSSSAAARSLPAIEQGLLSFWRRRDLAEALMTETTSSVASTSARFESLSLEPGSGRGPAVDRVEQRLLALPVRAVLDELVQWGLPAGDLSEAAALLEGSRSLPEPTPTLDLPSEPPSVGSGSGMAASAVSSSSASDDRDLARSAGSSLGGRSPGEGGAEALGGKSAPGFDTPSWGLPDSDSALEGPHLEPLEFSDGVSLLPRGSAPALAGRESASRTATTSLPPDRSRGAMVESTDHSHLTFQTARSDFGDSTEGEEFEGRAGASTSNSSSFMDLLLPPAGAVRLPRQPAPREEPPQLQSQPEPPMQPRPPLTSQAPSWGEMQRQLQGGQLPFRLAPKARIQQQLQRARDPAWQALNSPSPWEDPATPAPARELLPR